MRSTLFPASIFIEKSQSPRNHETLQLSTAISNASDRKFRGVEVYNQLPNQAKPQHTSTSEPRKPTPPSVHTTSPCSRHNSPPRHPPPSAKQAATRQRVSLLYASAVPTSPLLHGRWGPRRTGVNPRNPQARMRTRSARQSRFLLSMSTASSSHKSKNNPNPNRSSATMHPLPHPRSFLNNSR